METKTDLTVAKTILDQLGGNRFIAMVGARNIAGDDTSINMRIMKNKSKGNYLRIKLNSLDLYNMQFISIGKDYNLIVRVEKNNVYAEDLQDIFTSVTGLNTRL